MAWRISAIFLHQSISFSYLTLEEAVDADLAAVGVEGDGGGAGSRNLSLKHRMKMHEFTE